MGWPGEGIAVYGKGNEVEGIAWKHQAPVQPRRGFLDVTYQRNVLTQIECY